MLTPTRVEAPVSPPQSVLRHVPFVLLFPAPLALIQPVLDRIELRKRRGAHLHRVP